MEPYKAKKLELNYNYSNDILKILNDTMEVYGEYKGYLKNMSYDYKNFLDTLFVNETYYSFKIDNIDIKKEDMFYIPYKNKNNTVIEFINMRKALIVGLTESNKTGFDTLFFNKMNKIPIYIGLLYPFLTYMVYNLVKRSSSNHVSQDEFLIY